MSGRVGGGVNVGGPPTLRVRSRVTGGSSWTEIFQIRFSDTTVSGRAAATANFQDERIVFYNTLSSCLESFIRGAAGVYYLIMIIIFL